MFTLALGKNIGQENEPFILAGKSTLNRIEHCPENVEQGAKSRYHKILEVKWKIALRNKN